MDYLKHMQSNHIIMALFLFAMFGLTSCNPNKTEVSASTELQSDAKDMRLTEENKSKMASASVLIQQYLDNEGNFSIKACMSDNVSPAKCGRINTRHMQMMEQKMKDDIGRQLSVAAERMQNIRLGIDENNFDQLVLSFVDGNGSFDFGECIRSGVDAEQCGRLSTRYLKILAEIEIQKQKSHYKEINDNLREMNETLNKEPTPPFKK